MLSFEEFMEKVFSEFLNYMPEEYKDKELALVRSVNVNKVLHTLVIKNVDMSPKLYIEDMYEHYQYCNSFEDAISFGAKIMHEGFLEMGNFALKIPNAETFDKEGVVFRMINAEKNAELLEEVPHRLWLDFAIIYYCVVSLPDDQRASYLVTNKICEDCGLTEKMLYELAFENTKKLYEPDVAPIDYFMRSTLLNSGVPEFLIDMMIGDCSEPFSDLFVLTNKQRHCGAVNMVYSDVVASVADMIGSDIYILPSSINDVICVSVNELEAEDFLEIVHEVNETGLREEEFLSNNIYCYKRDTKELFRYK